MGSVTVGQERGRRGNSHPRKEQVCGAGEGGAQEDWDLMILHVWEVLYSKRT